MEPRRGEPKSAEDSGHYSAHASADHTACSFGFPPREQSHDYSNYNQHDDSNAYVKRTDRLQETWFFGRWSRRRRSSWRRRSILFRQHRLRILQALESIVVLRVYFQSRLIIRNSVFVLQRQTVGVAALRHCLGIIRVLAQEKCVISNSCIVVFHPSVCQRAPIITLQIVWFFLDKGREICDRLIPLAESELGKASELKRGKVVWFHFQCFGQISQGRVILFKLDLSLTALDISGRVFRREFNVFCKIGHRRLIPGRCTFRISRRRSSACALTIRRPAVRIATRIF